MVSTIKEITMLTIILRTIEFCIYHLCIVITAMYQRYKFMKVPNTKINFSAAIWRP